MADRSESGYSLIELMIVVGVIGALMMATMPTLSGATRRTHDRSAQTALRQAMSTAQTMDGDRTAWHDPGSTCAASAVDAAALQNAEPALTFEGGPDAPSRYGSIGVNNNSTCSRLRLISRAAADRFYAVELTPGGVIGFCFGTREEVSSPAPCDASGW